MIVYSPLNLMFWQQLLSLFLGALLAFAAVIGLAFVITIALGAGVANAAAIVIGLFLIQAVFFAPFMMLEKVARLFFGKSNKQTQTDNLATSGTDQDIKDVTLTRLFKAGLVGGGLWGAYQGAGLFGST